MSSDAPAAVPAYTRQGWDAAMAELSNLVLAAPEMYESAMTLVRRTVDALRPECPDVAALLAAVDRARALAAAAAEQAGLPAAGLRPELIAGASLALLMREVTERQVRGDRLAHLAAARDQGLDWAVLEEIGDPGGPAPGYRRVEVHVATGAALIASVELDGTLSRPAYWLRPAWFDPATGSLGPTGDDSAGQEYPDQAGWQAAQAQARARAEPGAS